MLAQSRFDHSDYSDIGIWNDMIAVSADGDHIVALKSDGTVLAVGENDDGECDVTHWDLWDE